MNYVWDWGLAIKMYEGRRMFEFILMKVVWKPNTQGLLLFTLL